MLIEPQVIVVSTVSVETRNRKMRFFKMNELLK